MNPDTWLAQAEAALNALENASQAGQAEALTVAAGQLRPLTQQFGQMSPASRERLRPQLTRLLGRMNTLTAKLEHTRAAAAGELKDLRQQGHALNAYLVSDFKNRL